MYKKRENNLTYFLGGAAVGVAAGFLVGKLLSNTLTETQTSKPSRPIEKYGKKYSQDDNIHSLNRANVQPCHTRSKSESRYENKDSEKQPVPATSLTVLNDSFTNNLNNPTHKKKDSTNIQKICYNSNYCVYNISMEDYGLSNEADANCEEKEYNDSNSSESKNMKMVNTYTVSLENVKDKNSSEALNKNLPKDIRTSDNVKFAKISNNLPKIVHAKDSTVFKDIRGKNNLMNNSNISQDCTKHVSNMATYNSILDFKDENESEMLDSKDFCETDLVSSTKRNNLDNI